MTPQAYLTHSLDHRVRIKIPSRKKDRSFFSSVSKELGRFPTIEQVTTNPVTGSVLILHRGDWNFIAEKAQHQNLFKMTEKEKFQKLDEQMEYEGLLTIVASGAIGLSVLQSLRGHLLPPAWTLFGDACRILSKLESIKKSA